MSRLGSCILRAAILALSLLCAPPHKVTRLDIRGQAAGTIIDELKGSIAIGDLTQTGSLSEFA